MRAVFALVVLSLLLSGCPKDDDEEAGMTGGGSTAGQLAGQAAGSTGSTAGATAAGSGAGTAGMSTSGTGTSGSGTSGMGGDTSGTGGSDTDAAIAADGGLNVDECDLPCDPGKHCELVQVACIQAPCPPQPECVEDAANGGTNDCDLRKAACFLSVPKCPEGQVPSVSSACFGPCVDVETCSCDEAADCPDSDHYTCHLSAGHCGPYVN